MTSRLMELFPRTADRFGESAEDFALYTLALAEHGWQASSYLFWHADDLTVRAVSWRDAGNLFSSYRFSILLWKFREECAVMAGRKPKESRAVRAKWVGFLDYRLSDDELMDLDSWKPTTAEIWECVDTLIEGGYRVALSYNATLKVASCTLMDDDAERRSGGYGLSSSDTDGAAALKAAVFKHFHVLSGDWAQLVDAPLTRGARG